MPGWLRRLRARIKYRHFDSDLRHEIETHRSMLEDDLGRRGADRETARASAARALGNVTLAREDARRVWMAAGIESVSQDVRYALRSLRQSPAFTFAAILALVVALGLNTSLFTAVNALLLQPWRVPHAGDVVMAFETRQAARGDIARNGVPVIRFRQLHDQATTIDLTAMRNGRATMVTPARRQVIDLRLVDASYFQTLQVPLTAGRGFRADEDIAGQPVPVVVIADEIWRRDFDGARDVVGRTMALQDVAFAVVGVAPAGFTDSRAEPLPSVWIPLAALPVIQPLDPFAPGFLTEPTHCCVKIAGRLRPGASRIAAQAELTNLDRAVRTEALTPADGIALTGTALVQQPEMRNVVPVFALLSAGLFLVLLLACANVSNLQLARGMSRRREMTIRLSLGAGRRRLVQQLLVEGAVLSLASSVAAWLIARWLPLAILRQVDEGDFSRFDFMPDTRVLVFMVAMAAFATLASGLAPALRSTRTLVAGRFDLTDRRTRLRSLLLGAQIGISAMLLLGGALLVRGVMHAASIDPGFAVNDTRTVAIGLPDELYRLAKQPERMARFSRTLLEAAARADLTIGATSLVPLGNAHVTMSVRLNGESEQQARRTFLHQVSPGYFTVLRIPMRAGRAFDGRPSSREIVVNESLARSLWPDTPPANVLGRVVEVDGNREIVGVAADVRSEALDRVELTLYQPIGEFTQVLIRDSNPELDRLKAIVLGIEPLATFTFDSLADTMAERLRASSVGAAIAMGLGLLALMLATVGTFGVFSFVVGERTREIGVRVALGGRARQILAALLARVAWPLAGGLACGLAGALVLGPVMRDLLYGLSPRDPVAFFAVAVVLALAAALALIIPARRALRVDPVVTLRVDAS